MKLIAVGLVLLVVSGISLADVSVVTIKINESATFADPWGQVPDLAQSSGQLRKMALQHASGSDEVGRDAIIFYRVDSDGRRFRCIDYLGNSATVVEQACYQLAD